MKIAFPTDDGETINAHLGRSACYAVLDRREGMAPIRVNRIKPRHTGHGHGHVASVDVLTPLDSAPLEHGGMLAPVADCHVLAAGVWGLRPMRPPAPSACSSSRPESA